MRVIPGWMVEARTASVDELGFKMIKLAFSSLMRSTSGQLNHILPSMQYMAPSEAEASGLVPSPARTDQCPAFQKPGRSVPGGERAPGA